MKSTPSLDDFDRKLRSFGDVDTEIGHINDLQNIGALSLRTVSIKAQLRSECHRWSVKFSDNLHGQSKNKLEQLTEFIRMTNGKVVREVRDLDSLRFIMKLLVDVRERESSMEMEINPIMDMYRMLESYLPAGFMDKVCIQLLLHPCMLSHESIFVVLSRSILIMIMLTTIIMIVIIIVIIMLIIKMIIAIITIIIMIITIIMMLIIYRMKLIKRLSYERIGRGFSNNQK